MIFYDRVSFEELVRRTLRKHELKADRSAFVDTRIPGSDTKLNYPLIGPGVSENDEQIVPLTDDHGFNLGAASMPAGTTNNLHLHFTAEVFTCLGGQWTFRWGVDGDDGEVVVEAGDVISIPTWVFRGFTQHSGDGNFLFTTLGRDVSGGLIWAPTVLAAAAKTGLHLTIDNKLIETQPGDSPTGVRLKSPLTDEQLASLPRFTSEEIRSRLSKPSDLQWCDKPFLDSRLDTGGAELATVVGYGITENRNQRPRLADPHGFNMAWLRALPERGMSWHRIFDSEVLIVTAGRWRVTLNQVDPVSVEVDPGDTISIPKGAWRRLESVSETVAQAMLITGTDGRTLVDWAPNVVEAARETGVVIDANGYVAAAAMIYA